jgi:hypothetical protein
MSIYSSVRTGGPSFREDENEKLNNLIEDYRRENERCSQKIQELQEKLNVTTNKFVNEGGRNATLGNNASSFGSRGTLGDTNIAATRSSVAMVESIANGRSNPNSQSAAQLPYQ